VSLGGSTCLVLFLHALSFPLLAVITALTLCPVFITTNSIYGAIYRAMLLVITTLAQNVYFSFMP
jgi:hypothetical protein